MTSRICPSDPFPCTVDEDQAKVIKIFESNKHVLVEAPPGTGKTFLGVYFSTRNEIKKIISKDQQVLFLTFSRNARVRIEREVQKFITNGWVDKSTLRLLRISNFHSFFLEIIQKKAGFWGCTNKIRPSPVEFHQKAIENILHDKGYESNREEITKANSVFAAKRFSASELMLNDINIDDDTYEEIYNLAVASLINGRPYYDDFAPLVFQILEQCPEMQEWLRMVYPVFILDEFQDVDFLQFEIIKKINPEHLLILYDRYQMIYGWRGADLSRIDQVKNIFDIDHESEVFLKKIHRVGDAADLANFYLTLREDELVGETTRLIGKGNWLSLRSVENRGKIPESQWRKIPDATKCLNEIRYAKGLIKFDESTAIITRGNYLAEYLYNNLRIKNKGLAVNCRWIGSDNNQDEKIRDLVWQLREVDDDQRLRMWIGKLFVLLIPQKLVSDYKINFPDEFSKGKDEILKLKRKPELISLREQLKLFLYPLGITVNDNFSRLLKELPSLASRVVSSKGFIDNDVKYFIVKLAELTEAFIFNSSEKTWLNYCDHIESGLTSIIFNKIRLREKGVYLLTVHQSKGREFDHVIIPWLSSRGELLEKRDGRKFPFPYNFSSFEDRRLLYVALTRARSRVTIIYPKDDPSIFFENWGLREN